mmetsp:Transcript_65378/g.117715  ORF Transcript_65378/g.117715 Transcript_65378/m.117715 type:complete len:120 (-) Transcript_65378:677-1036(-)
MEVTYQFQSVACDWLLLLRERQKQLQVYAVLGHSLLELAAAATAVLGNVFLGPNPKAAAMQIFGGDFASLEARALLVVPAVDLARLICSPLGQLQRFCFVAARQAGQPAAIERRRRCLA